ncbi:MAG: azurin [Psychroflexus sp.]
MKKLLGLLMISAFIAVGCGGNDKKSEDKKDSIKLKSAEPEKETEEKQEGVSEVYLTGNDKMKYNKTEIRVNAGDEVVLTFEHVGEMSVETMGHNFVLLKEGTDVQKFGEKAVEAKDNNYIPEDTDVVIVHTEMIGGGEKTEITFQAPEKGKYDFVCSFPGHLALMRGVFVVE